MREGNDLIGWGMATGVWEAMRQAASARVVLTNDGRLEVACAMTDIGTGTYTMMAQIAADMLGVADRRRDVETGRLDAAQRAGAGRLVDGGDGRFRGARRVLEGAAAAIRACARHGGFGSRQARSSKTSSSRRTHRARSAIRRKA